MPSSKPPAGYVGVTGAEEITGYSSQTILRAVKAGELKAVQRKTHAQWFFLPADLRQWRGIEDTTEVAS